MAAPVILVVDMGMYRPSWVRKIVKELTQIPGVVDVWASPETGEVTIVGMAADEATLKALVEAQLEAKGYGTVLPPLPAPGSPPPPAPPASVGGHNQPRYVTPPRKAGDYCSPLGVRYPRPEDGFYSHRCCCSIL